MRRFFLGSGVKQLRHTPHWSGERVAPPIDRVKEVGLRRSTEDCGIMVEDRGPSK